MHITKYTTFFMNAIYSTKLDIYQHDILSLVIIAQLFFGKE